MTPMLPLSRSVFLHASSVSREGKRIVAKSKSSGTKSPTRPARRPKTADRDAPRPKLRPKVARRRQIDPTTCERDYSTDEVEFMRALDAYKRSSGRMFPTCSEILEVIRGLGYVKQEESDAPEQP